MEYDIFEKFALLTKEDQVEVLSEMDACLQASSKISTAYPTETSAGVAARGTGAL